MAIADSPYVSQRPDDDRKRQTFLHDVENDNRHHNHPVISHGHNNRKGWPGIVALVCCYFFFPAAIVFGIIGVNKKYKNRGFAIAALIISGIIVIIALALVFSFVGF